MENATNPIVIVFFYLIRCVIPLLIMLGISYILQKIGLISNPPSQPGKTNSAANEIDNNQGDFAHGKA